MVKRARKTDLFGEPLKTRRPRYEASLERADKRTLAKRAGRVRHLSRLIPRGQFLGLPPESHYVFTEAQACYVGGQFTATLLLSAAFIEHWMLARLSEKGIELSKKAGLAEATQMARQHGLVNSAVLAQIDHLRRIRNPFVHLQPFDHPHTLPQRMRKSWPHPDELLEADARSAMELVWTVIQHM
jgi:hypothetical protein